MIFKKKKHNSIADDSQTEDDQTCLHDPEISDVESEDIHDETASAPEECSAEEAENEKADETSDETPDDTSDDDAEQSEEDADEAEPLSDFEASIKNFSAADTATAVENPKKSLDYIRVIVLAVCIVVCLISTSTLITNIRDKIRSEQIYGDIIDSVADGFNADGGVLTNGGKISLLAADSKTAFTPTMDEIIKNGIGEVTTPSDRSAELAKMRASLESLRNINEDIYAWIKIPNTNINYPVAQTDNNEYYLDHAYTGDNLVNGSIFADFRCNGVITKNYNTVFYGHNITSGSMFHDVEKFFDEKVFKDTQIYVYTFDGIYIFKPFSVHEVEYDSGFVDMGFPTGEDFVNFATELAKQSEIKSDISFTGNDRILTLSTCTNGIRTKRYALHGVLIEAITD